jgi:hypothetical protein
MNTLHQVELVTYGSGFWIARVNDKDGKAYDVAKIWSNSAYIYDADVDIEEGYSQSQDPHLAARFYVWHPQYFDNDLGSFKDWPPSLGGNTNELYAYPSSICPQYYGAIIDTKDPRYWYAGTGGNTCNSTMFPPSRIFLPLIIRN